MKGSNKWAKPSILFLSRVAGFPIPMLLVAKLGLNESNNHFFVQIAVMSAAGSIIGSLTELQGISLAAKSDTPISAQIVSDSFRLGLATSGLATFLSMIMFHDSSTTIFASALLFVVPLGNSMQGALTGHYTLIDDWLSPAILNYLRSGIAMIGLFLCPNSILACALILAIAEGPRLVAGISFLSKYPRKAHQDPTGLRKLVVRQAPGSLLSAANPVMDRYIVDILSLGSVALLDLSEKTASLVSFAITLGLIPAIYPALARDFRPERIRHYQRLVFKTTLLLGLCTFLLAAILVHLKVIPHHLMPNQWLTLFGLYLIGTPAYATAQLNVRALVLLGRIGDVVRLSAILLIVNISMDVVLAHHLRLQGIAIASVLTGWTSLSVTALFLGKHQIMETEPTEADLTK